MARTLLAANRIQADLAGLTGTRHDPPAAAATSPTEFISSVVHGESGGLHFLWDDVPVPVSSATPAADPVAPKGGTGHPDVGGRFLGRGVPVVAPRAVDETGPALAAPVVDDLAGMFG
jgi:hypothetical protein